MRRYNANSMILNSFVGTFRFHTNIPVDKVHLKGTDIG